MGRIDYVNDNEYDLFIRPDTCCPRFRCWFLFTVENVKVDQVSICHRYLHKINRIQLKYYIVLFLLESYLSYC